MQRSFESALTCIFHDICMTIMFQAGSCFHAASMLALAAAGGAISASPAAAGSACQLGDGYATELVAYVDQVTACLDQTDVFDPVLENLLFELTNSDRADAGVARLNRRASLDQAARAHALDMAERGYAGHNDLEGRGHVYRMRALDREVFASVTGGNVAVLESGTEARAIYRAIQADETNRANMFRDSFTDTGIGVAEKGGKVYVVQMLTRIDGELSHPLPLKIAGMTEISPRLNEAMFRAASWSLTDASGRRLSGSRAMRLSETALSPAQEAYLNLIVEVDTDVYVLRGPAVSRQ